MVSERRRKRKPITLPTMAVGGDLPPESVKEEIKKDTEKKVEKYISENPQKPEDTTPDIAAPLSIKTEVYSLDNEYIDLAKRYLDIPQDISVNLVGMAKAVIKKVEYFNEVIKKLSQPRNDGFGRVLMSSECNDSWN